MNCHQNLTLMNTLLLFVNHVARRMCDDNKHTRESTRRRRIITKRMSTKFIKWKSYNFDMSLRTFPSCRINSVFDFEVWKITNFSSFLLIINIRYYLWPWDPQKVLTFHGFHNKIWHARLVNVGNKTILALY